MLPVAWMPRSLRRGGGGRSGPVGTAEAHAELEGRFPARSHLAEQAAGALPTLVPEGYGYLKAGEGMGIGPALSEPGQKVECAGWQERDEDAPESRLGPDPGADHPGLLLGQGRGAARQAAVPLVALRAEFPAEGCLSAVIFGPPTALPAGTNHGVLKILVGSGLGQGLPLVHPDWRRGIIPAHASLQGRGVVPLASRHRTLGGGPHGHAQGHLHPIRLERKTEQKQRAENAEEQVHAIQLTRCIVKRCAQSLIL